MKSNKLTNQGGSVATFVVVGVVLAAFVIGGVYLLQKRSQDGSKTGPVVVNTTSQSPTSSPKATMSPSVTPEVSKTPSASPVKPAPTKTPTPSTASNMPTTASLPTTGPTEDFAGAIMLAVLAGLAVAYLRSHRVRYGHQTE